MSLVPKIYINPYGKKPYKSSSSKSIFKDQNLHSNIIRAVNVNELTNLFENDSIIYGLEITDVSLKNQRSIEITLSPGRIIQDNTLIDVHEEVNLSIDVISTYDIIESNKEQNYFVIAGDQTKNFTNSKQFTIQNSNYEDYNHGYWITQKVELNEENTIVYPSQNISENNVSGQIVNDNFPNNRGTILIFSKYIFYESLYLDQVEFLPVYTITENFATVSKCIPSFDPNLHRILYGVIYIDKSSTEIEKYNYISEGINISVSGNNYTVRKSIKQFDHYNGGEILLC